MLLGEKMLTFCGDVFTFYALGQWFEDGFLAASL